MTLRTLLALAAIASLPSLALAQGHSGHSGHASPAPSAQSGHGAHGSHAATPAETPATQAFRDANAKMHRDMDIAFTNDPDADFVRGMIPHHQGAIDMAKVILQHGKDDETRKWATAIIREQEREITEMREWLKKRGR